MKIFSNADSELLIDLYDKYNNIIKPLIATYEAREEAFPTPIYNEIRAFNDHIAKCYRKDISPGSISKELKRAERHIKRIIYDCFKFLNVSLDSFIVRFEKQTSNIDLTTINSGDFYYKYKKLRKEATSAVRDAKTIEAKADMDEDGKVEELAFNKYEEAYNSYCELEDLIYDNTSNIKWAKAKFRIKRYAWLVPLIISTIISSIIGGVFSCDWLKDLF